MGKISFPDWLAQHAQQVEAALQNWLPAVDTPVADAVQQAQQAPVTIQTATLHAAMRYAVLGGGKRVRAALVYAAGEIGLKAGVVLSPAQHVALNRAAAAVELMHAYSLVHDDLPCMDDDDLRRGRASVHKQYGEATALLVGDALQPLAFEWLVQMPIAPALVVQSVQILARAVGSRGMVGGQFMDCVSVGQTLTHEQLQTMHAMKTGALLQASILLGGVVAGAGSQQREALEDYARAVGLAFQVADDILDSTADTATLGKTAGKDAARHKPTYTSLLGVEAARQLLADLTAAAHTAVRTLGQAGARLVQLADFIAERSH